MNHSLPGGPGDDRDPISAPVIAIVPTLNLNKFGMLCNAVSKAYTDAVIRAGGIPFLLPVTADDTGGAGPEADLIYRRLLATADGVLFTGGDDIAPARFGQEAHPKTNGVIPVLDEAQLHICRLSLELDLPVLAICRGCQLVNVALGGDLIQDIPDYLEGQASADGHGRDIIHMPEKPGPGPHHDVRIERDSMLWKVFQTDRLPVNSAHHQSVDRPGDGLRITARSDDGIIEALEHETRPVWLIQWHPELMLTADDAMLPLFRFFTGACIASTEKGRNGGLRV